MKLGQQSRERVRVMDQGRRHGIQDRLKVEPTGFVVGMNGDVGKGLTYTGWQSLERACVGTWERGCNSNHQI